MSIVPRNWICKGGVPRWNCVVINEIVLTKTNCARLKKSLTHFVNFINLNAAENGTDQSGLRAHFTGNISYVPDSTGFDR